MKLSNLMRTKSKSNRTESKRIESNRIEINRIETKSIEFNRIEINRIESNSEYALNSRVSLYYIQIFELLFFMYNIVLKKQSETIIKQADIPKILKYEQKAISKKNLIK